MPATSGVPTRIYEQRHTIITAFVRPGNTHNSAAATASHRRQLTAAAAVAHSRDHAGAMGARPGMDVRVDLVGLGCAQRFVKPVSLCRFTIITLS